MNPITRACVLACGTAALVACGAASAPPAASPAAPASDETPRAEREESADREALGPAKHAVAPSTTSASAPSSTPASATATGAPAKPMDPTSTPDLASEERRVEASLGDCVAACRALASMASAATHLCGLDGGDACAHARRRVEAARQRVTRACGTCPGT